MRKRHRNGRDAEIGTARFERTFHVERSAINAEARTIELAFSSELAYERWWGIEILDHGTGSVRLGRLNGGGHPLLVNHDPNKQAGVLEKAWIGEDRVGRSLARFGKSAFAEEIFGDVTDGIRTLVSVGYSIHKVVEQSTSKSGEVKERTLTGEQFRNLIDSEDFKRSIEDGRRAGEDPVIYRVVDWEPFENSLVAIPADPSVGVGRAAASPEKPQPSIHIEDKAMDEEQKKAAEKAAAEKIAADVEAARRAAGAAEAERVREILAMAHHYKMDEQGQKAVADGTPTDGFRKLVMEELQKKSTKATEGNLGMSDQEVRQFSFVRAIHALANPADRKAQEAASFEFEASAAAAQKAGKTSRGIMIPTDVLQRDLTTATTSGTSKAGYMVATDLLSGSFIDVLRNAMVLPRLGATFLTGLQGNVAIPKKTTASTSYWVAENSAPTEGALVFGQVTLSPKTLAAYVDFSRRLSLQSSLDIESLVRNDLATGIAVALDEAALGGAKTNGPTGVRGTSGIGSVAIGTNGGAPTWASIVNLVKAVDVANALTGSASFVTNAKVKGKLAQTPKQSSGVEGNFLLGPPWDSLYGYPFHVTQQIPSNLTKGSSSGVCSAMLFGVWRDLLIGQWSGIDLLVDPYTGSSAATVRVTAFVDVDVAVRYAESFAACLDYTTT